MTDLEARLENIADRLNLPFDVPTLIHISECGTCEWDHGCGCCGSTHTCNLVHYNEKTNIYEVHLTKD